MNQVIELFGWEHIHTIEVLKPEEILMEISELEPTMVPAFLLGVDKVKINSQIILINKNEVVTIATYYSVEGSILGYAVIYKGDIAYEKRI
ncbi:hypothetical protein [Weissella koreensis]|uniref:hypothetical protein n=1 Tax=Weissella koreensis TaxID=165096 RepID=UPI001EE66504|nr:hypothetical protein [Weissella koreensis]